MQNLDNRFRDALAFFPSSTLDVLFVPLLLQFLRPAERLVNPKVHPSYRKKKEGLKDAVDAEGLKDALGACRIVVLYGPICPMNAAFVYDEGVGSSEKMT